MSGTLYTLADLEAALLAIKKKQQGDEDELPQLLTKAVVAGLSEFTDEAGNLKVRQNTGGHPLGGA